MEKGQNNFYVIKRNGDEQPVLFDKITERILNCCKINPDISKNVDAVLVAQKVVSGVFPGVKTTELDNLAAETAAYMSTIHPDYGLLAARIAISNLQKDTSDDFFVTMKKEYEYVHPKTKEASPLLSQKVYEYIEKNKDVLNKAIDYTRDFQYDFFGFKTLERSYLVRLNGGIVERPQHMLMRVAVGVHYPNMDDVLQSYEYMSKMYFTHATPTLFNASTNTPQMSSCYLLSMKEDSIDGIYDTLKRCALISKSAGGIGLSASIIRASQSHIKGTNGSSNGLVPMLKVFNDTARYVDQGGGKRKGAFAIYLEMWHADIFEFLDLKKNTGKEEQRARDLFYALWVCDLFMKRVEENGSWSLFCPNEAPGLSDVWGDEFEKLYEKYEKTPGLARKTIKAQSLWFAIIDSQIETGTPYMLYKDSVNRKSNQQNLGTIQSSNLCCEIMEYTDKDQVAVCNLASANLKAFVVDDKFDHYLFYKVVKFMTKSLHKIIFRNYYPIPEAEKSNLMHAPIGLGVQGMAETCFKLKIPYDSVASEELNHDIFESLYFSALTSSNELAQKHGPYKSYQGSPMSKGLIQPDLWGHKVVDKSKGGRWKWDNLREKIAKHGVANSLLVAPMPTASTSQMMGNTESFEPQTSNIFTRRVLAGEFTIVNRFLIEDLEKLGLWNANMKNIIIAHGGSIQKIDVIPNNIKDMYKTIWEIGSRKLIDMAAIRSPYIDQSQSFNAYIAEPTYAKLTSMHFYAWKKGLKTGMYYLRSRPAADAIQFTVDQSMLQQQQPADHTINENNRKRKNAPIEMEVEQEFKKQKQSQENLDACRMEEGCLVCGS